MTSSILEFFTHFKNFQKFRSGNYYNNNSLVVYSEGSHDWPHLGPILKKIFHISDLEIIYLTSSNDDPGLDFKNKKYKSFYIGSGLIRILIFQLIRCKVILLTLPDLDNFHLKKNKNLNIKYVYTFHSINSTHAAYRHNAFNAYDFILCVGPHHKKELKKDNEIKKIKNRFLLEHGSVKLDTLIKDFIKFKGPTNNKKLQVILAPSWGIGSFIENNNLSTKIINALIKSDYKIILRLHPMTLRKSPNIINKLIKNSNIDINDNRFKVEINHNDNSSIKKADLMISDWSGAATEFAFALERPVLFIDTKQKINNKKWIDYGLPCLEDTIRDIIGTKISINEISQIKFYVDLLLKNHAEIRKKIIKAKDDNIYNLGKSDIIGAQHLVKIVKNS